MGKFGQKFRLFVLKFAPNKEGKMPVINVKMTLEDGGLSAEDKALLARKLTDSFVEVTGRGQKTCVVIIDEVSTDNYAIGGEMVSEIRKKKP